MNPKASCGVLYPPLRGIVQLVNSNTLRFRNWSFTIIFNKNYYVVPKLTLFYVMKKRGQSPGLAALCGDGISPANVTVIF
jgi:hypothetical protein